MATERRFLVDPFGEPDDAGCEQVPLGAVAGHEPVEGEGTHEVVRDGAVQSKRVGNLAQRGPIRMVGDQLQDLKP